MLIKLLTPKKKKSKKLHRKPFKIAPKNSSRMHLPTGATAVYHHHTATPTIGSTGATGGSAGDWNLPSQKGGMLEPPSSNSSGSPPGTQDLWWTERLVIEAQQEFPGELGK